MPTKPQVSTWGFLFNVLSIIIYNFGTMFEFTRFKKMKQLSLTLLALLAINITYGQNANPNNLVLNASFEEVEKKIKEAGQITSATPWRSATMNPVDIYSTEAKSEDFGVPANKYGKEKARTGNNYAGIAFYGYRGKRSRTYLETELKQPLEAGKTYCVKFYVSLSDMSKYASNNLSAHLSKEEIQETNEANLELEPHVQSLTNKVFVQQFLWKPVCGTYEATGGEKFLTIGNFKSDDETVLEKIRLSKDFSGRQEYDAYYFIDDISVIDTEKLKEGDCMCDEIAGGKMEVEYKSFGSTPNKKANKTTLYNSDGTVATKDGEMEETKVEGKEVVESKKEEVKQGFDIKTASIFFATKKSEPKASESEKLQKVADYLKKNPKAKLEIVGHYDASETEIKFLGKRRSLAIRKKLEALGISEARMILASQENNMPHSSGKAENNQRVSFIVK